MIFAIHHLHHGILEASDQKLNELLNTIGSLDQKYVVITGGEPMLQKSITELTAALHLNGHHITIETAGTISRAVHCDLMSISPKMSNSTPSLERAGEWQAKHEKARLRPELVKELISEFEYQLKFVIADPADIIEVLSYLDSVDQFEPKNVMLMPEGINQETLASRADWIQVECDKLGFTYCPRMHIQWYGNKRGT